MSIVITREGRNAEKIDRTPFRDEDYLQSYIYGNPGSIPLYEIDDNIRLLILAREFPTASGPIDAIGIDETGGIYVIETKLYKNPDKRLVVAQVLDYGAALSFNYSDFGAFLQEMEAKVSQHFGTSLHSKISGFFGLPDDAAEEVVQNMKTNLDKGKFRFVVLMDSLEKRLRDLILFLNRNSRFDIYGVELEYYKYKDFEIVIPKLFGAEVKKEVDAGGSAAGARRRWDEGSFFEEVKNKFPENYMKAIRDLYEFSKKTAGRITWGTGALKGSFNAIYDDICPRSLFTVETNGVLRVNHFWMDDNDRMRHCRGRLTDGMRRIFGVPADQPLPTWNIEEWADKAEEIKVVIGDLRS